MRKKRIQSAQRASHRTLSSLSTKKKDAQAKQKFIGVSLSGGKTDKTSIALIEYYPDQKRIFLAQLIDRVKPEEHVSADKKIHDFLHEHEESCESVIFDCPLTFPKCLRCELECPGFEVCNEPEIKWMRGVDQRRDKKRPKRHFTPYTQRPVELLFQDSLEEKFDIQDALGANLAPLVARAHFISRRLRIPFHETMTKVAVWKLGIYLKINKSVLRKWWSSVGGAEARKIILTQFSEKANVFFYQQDLRTMTENPHAFEALICAYVGLLKHQGRVEPTPNDFPPEEGWVEIPYFGSYSK